MEPGGAPLRLLLHGLLCTTHERAHTHTPWSSWQSSCWPQQAGSSARQAPGPPGAWRPGRGPAPSAGTEHAASHGGAARQPSPRPSAPQKHALSGPSIQLLLLSGPQIQHPPAAAATLGLTRGVPVRTLLYAILLFLVVVHLFVVCAVGRGMVVLLLRKWAQGDRRVAGNVDARSELRKLLCALATRGGEGRGTACWRSCPCAALSFAVLACRGVRPSTPGFFGGGGAHFQAEELVLRGGACLPWQLCVCQHWPPLPLLFPSLCRVSHAAHFRPMAISMRLHTNIQRVQIDTQQHV